MGANSAVPPAEVAAEKIADLRRRFSR